MRHNIGLCLQILNEYVQFFHHALNFRVQGGALIGRWENLFGQISKPSLVPNISFNFKDSLCHIVSGGAIATPTFFFSTMTSTF